MSGNKIKVAVLTGGHPYDAPHFNEMLKSIPGIDYNIMAVSEFCTDFGGFVDKYDVIIFFNMTRETPVDKKAWDMVSSDELISIGERGQGIIVLHHALLAFEDWEVWTDITGLGDRKNYNYFLGEHVKLHIEDELHPITKGVNNWELIDETYNCKSAGKDSHVLISTDNPHSMETIAWTKMYKNSRVFCFQAGHDKYSYTDSSFRNIMKNGIKWACGKEC